MKIKIEFETHEDMIYAAIEYLLSYKKEVTKASIKEACYFGLLAEGQLFENSPIFNLGDEIIDQNILNNLYNKFKNI